MQHFINKHYLFAIIEQLLIDSGANPQAETEDGKIAICYAGKDKRNFFFFFKLIKLINCLSTHASRIKSLSCIFISFNKRS